MKLNTTIASLIVLSTFCSGIVWSQVPGMGYGPQTPGVPGHGPAWSPQVMMPAPLPGGMAPGPMAAPAQPMMTVVPGALPLHVASRMAQDAAAPAPVPRPKNGTFSAGCASCDQAGQCETCGDCGEPSCQCACGSGLVGRGGGPFGLGLLSGGLFGDGSAQRPARIWYDGEAILFFNKDRTLPELFTTSPTGTPFSQAGVIGQPGTTVLFGGGEVDNEEDWGYRSTLGLWLAEDQTLGLFGRFMRLGPDDITYGAASLGDPILARPFFDVDANQEDAEVIAYPGLARGTVAARVRNEVRAYDLLLRKMIYYGYCNRVDFIGGYHSTLIDDSVRVGHDFISTDPAGRVPVGTRLESEDVFKATNEFHGGQIGLMAEGYDGRLTWNLLTKISFGNTKETVLLRGSTVTTVPGFGAATSDEGLLVLPSNAGVYEQDEFTIVPELNLSVSYELSSALQLSIGYSMLYWSNAALAAPAIDRSINPTQIGGGALIGPARPAYQLTDESFWVQGITFGASGRF